MTTPDTKPIERFMTKAISLFASRFRGSHALCKFQLIQKPRFGRWVEGQDFHGNFKFNFTQFVCECVLFSLACLMLLNCAHLKMVWKISLPYAS